MKTFFLVIISILLVNCNRGGGDSFIPQTNVKNSKAYNDGPVILFGDSIANGMGATTEASSLKGCFNSSVSTPVLLKAQDGATSSDAKNFLDQTVSENPSLVIISLGGNDVLIDSYLGNFPADETFENLREIYQSLTSAGSVVVQIGLNPPDNPYYQVDSSRLPQLKQIAEEEGVLFVENTFQGLWNNNDLMMDMVHPNDAGYAIVCDRLKTAVTPHFDLN